MDDKKTPVTETEKKTMPRKARPKPQERIAVMFENTLVWGKGLYQPNKVYMVLPSEFKKMKEIPSALNKERPIVRKA